MFVLFVRDIGFIGIHFNVDMVAKPHLYSMRQRCGDPPGGGRDLAEIVRTMRPDIKVLYMSAHTDSAIAHRGITARGMGFLQKPFAPEQLALRVRSMLNAGLAEGAESAG